MKFAELGVQCRSVEKSEGMNCKRRFTYPSEAEAEELEEEAENGAQRTRTTNKSWNQKKKRRGYCVISDPGFFSLLLFLPCKRLQQCCFPNFRNLKHNQFIIVQIQKKKKQREEEIGCRKWEAESGLSCSRATSLYSVYLAWPSRLSFVAPTSFLLTFTTIPLPHLFLFLVKSPTYFHIHN